MKFLGLALIMVGVASAALAADLADCHLLAVGSSRAPHAASPPTTWQALVGYGENAKSWQEPPHHTIRKCPKARYRTLRSLPLTLRIPESWCYAVSAVLLWGSVSKPRIQCRALCRRRAFAEHRRLRSPRIYPA